MKGCRKKRAPRWNGAIWAVKCDNVSAHPKKRAVHPWMRIVAFIYYDVSRIALKPIMPSFQGRYSACLFPGSLHPPVLNAMWDVRRGVPRLFLAYAYAMMGKTRKDAPCPT